MDAAQNVADPRPAVLLYGLEGFGPALERGGFRVICWPEESDAQAALMAGAGSHIRAAVTTGIGGLPAAFLAGARSLGLICCVGAGYERFDPAQLALRGIRLVNGGALNADDVAEVALGLCIGLARQLPEADRMVREGRWSGAQLVTHRLRGRKCGILGMGAIGAAIAQRAAAFGMDVAWHGPRAKPDVAYPYHASALDLARWSGILMISCPLTAATERLVDDAMLDALGPDGILVNVARGAIVDEAALIMALRERRISAAGLDVFVDEPTDPARWATLDNVLLHPHAAGATAEARKDMQDMAVLNLQHFFAGQALLTALN